MPEYNIAKLGVELVTTSDTILCLTFSASHFMNPSQIDEERYDVRPLPALPLTRICSARKLSNCAVSSTQSKFLPLLGNPKIVSPRKANFVLLEFGLQRSSLLKL